MSLGAEISTWNQPFTEGNALGPQWELAFGLSATSGLRHWVTKKYSGVVIAHGRNPIWNSYKNKDCMFKNWQPDSTQIEALTSNGNTESFQGFLLELTLKERALDIPKNNQALLSGW